jgi:AcrR family transcriptional regulator
VSAALTSGRRRSDSSRQAILEATFNLLEEEGFDRLSIEGVAARAGVGKTTIYRWWPSKGVLAVEAFLSAVTPTIAFPDSSSARIDILRQIRALAELYRGPTGRFVREMIGASQHDPAMQRTFLEGFLQPRREAARLVFLRGIQTGEFRPDCDPDIAMDALYGPLYYRLLVSGASIDETFIAHLSDIVLHGLLSRPA